MFVEWYRLKNEGLQRVTKLSGHNSLLTGHDKQINIDKLNA